MHRHTGAPPPRAATAGRRDTVTLTLLTDQIRRSESELART